LVTTNTNKPKRHQEFEFKGKGKPVKEVFKELERHVIHDFAINR